MKKFLCIILTLAMLLGLLPAMAAESKAAIVDAAAYSYTVTPILSPFAYYIYVQTENPDPTSFRLVDKECRYYTENSYGEIRRQTSSNSYAYTKVDPGTYYFSPYIYPDVVYEDESTYRVKGGYIFRADGSYSDGGEFVLLKKTANGTTFLKDKFQETEITVPCDRLYTRNDYLITYCTNEEMTFFEKLSAVQSFLNKKAVYPRSVYDITKPIEERSHPFLAVSPYPELSLNEHYDFYESFWGGLLAAKVFPFVLDSLGFPGTIRQVAQELEPTCEVSSASAHWGVTITFNGTSKTYGGAGEGGYDPLYADRVQKVFTFQGDSEDFVANGSIDKVCTLLRSYEAPAAEDAEKYRDLIAGATFAQTIAATGGTWIRVATEGGFSYGTAIGYAVPFVDRVRLLSDAWVDGRYVGKHEAVEPGAKQEDHPTADIVLRNFTYTDRKGVVHTQDVIFEYSSYEDNWNARDFYFGFTVASFDPVPEELILTHEDVAAMDLDYNTNSLPTEGLIYDGKEYPGTPFKHKSVESVTIPESVTLRVGEDYRVPITVFPADAFDTQVNLSIADTSIVELKNSLYNDWILAVAPGSTIITATARDGLAQATCTVTVLPALCATHTFGTCQVDQAPTLESEGTYHRICSVCFFEESGVLPILSEKDYTVTVVKEATCLENGVAEYAWKNAQNLTFRVSTDFAPHKYAAIVTEPTCLDNGYTTHTCSVCGDSYIDSPVQAYGHSYAATVTTEPTKESVGMLTLVCERCQDTKTHGLPVLSVEDYLLTQLEAPTCTEEGVMQYTWKNTDFGTVSILCSIPVTDHSYEADVTEPTCTEEGYTTYTCSCGDSYTADFVAALGHSYEATVTAPTCTEEGYTIYTCHCGDSYTADFVAALGHSYEATVTAPTCTEEGYTTYTCSCGDNYQGDFVAALGHSYEAVVTEATCTEEGYTTYTCHCGDSYTADFVPTVEHTYYVTDVIAPTCEEEGFTIYTCACGDRYASDIVPALWHEWDEGVITLEPTETEAGEMLYTCLRCAQTMTEPIEPLGKDQCDGGDGCPSAIFTDAPDADNWAHAGIDFAIKHGLFNGMSATTFEPDTTMTRAMLVTVLWRYNGCPFQGVNIFTDVPPNEWYTYAVAWAADHGIVNGIAEGIFDPNGTITREQLATILFRYAASMGLETGARADLADFADTASVSSWAYDALSWAVAEGLITGMQEANGLCLAPLGSATRAQVATILMRYIEKNA